MALRRSTTRGNLRGAAEFEDGDREFRRVTGLTWSAGRNGFQETEVGRWSRKMG